MLYFLTNSPIFKKNLFLIIIFLSKKSSFQIFINFKKQEKIIKISIYIYWKSLTRYFANRSLAAKKKMNSRERLLLRKKNESGSLIKVASKVAIIDRWVVIRRNSAWLNIESLWNLQKSPWARESRIYKKEIFVLQNPGINTIRRISRLDVGSYFPRKYRRFYFFFLKKSRLDYIYMHEVSRCLWK